MNRSQLTLWLLAGVTCAAGCGGSGGDEDPGPLATSVAVNDSLPSVYVGDTTRLHATASTGSGPSSHKAVWSSANAQVATVDGTGVVTGVSAGTAMIRATVDTATIDVPVVVLAPRTRAATWLSYTLYSGSGNRVRVAYPNGGILWTLPTNEALAVDYNWSPDGSLFYYQIMTGSSILSYIVDANGVVVHDLGSSLVNLGQPDSPDISPDNGKMLYLKGLSPDLHVETMDLATKVVSIDTFAGLQHGPSWSPDGRRWAVTRRVSNVFQLVVHRADGSGARTLTPPSAADPGRPRWSPDGKYIATVCANAVWLVTPDGRYSTSIGGCGILVDCSVTHVSWSPDARTIAYARYGLPGPTYQVVVRPIFGSSEVVVGSGVNPEWSPDGLRIAYTAYTSAGPTPQVVTLVNPDGTDPRPLNSDAIAMYPIWRP
jgi:hypothetical protein